MTEYIKNWEGLKGEKIANVFWEERNRGQRNLLLTLESGRRLAVSMVGLVSMIFDDDSTLYDNRLRYLAGWMSPEEEKEHEDREKKCYENEVHRYGDGAEFWERMRNG